MEFFLQLSADHSGFPFAADRIFQYGGMGSGEKQNKMVQFHFYAVCVSYGHSFPGRYAAAAFHIPGNLQLFRDSDAAEL